MAGKKQSKHGNHKSSERTAGAGIDRKLHDPVADKLIPLAPLDLREIRSIDDLVRAMARTAFTGRQLGEAADVLEAMARDKDAFVVMTLAGAMTVAKQGLIIAELIERGIVNAIVSTGALMAHGLVEATGRAHFRHNPELSDEELYEAGYNRVYDTLEPEQNLDDVERVMHAVFGGWDAHEVMCSYKLNRAIGAYLSKTAKGQRGILKSAYENNVPVFVPAFSDSELGLDYALTNRERDKERKPRFRFDPFEDLEYFAATLLAQKRLGIFTIGGGVPRNWSQQFGPFIELRHRRGVKTCPSSAITMGCEFVLNRSTGADFPAVLTAKPYRGESSCRRQRVENSERSSSTRRLDCR